MIRNKRVAFFSLSYYPSSGGLVTYIDSFSTFLINKSVEVDVYCGDAKDSSLSRVEKYKSVIVHRFSVFKFSKWLQVISPLIVVYKFILYLKDINFEEYELVVCRHLYLAFALSFFKKAKYKTVFIIPLIAPKLQLINSKQEPFLKKIYSLFIVPQLYFLEKWSVTHLPYIGVLSKSKKEEVVAYYGITSHVEVIHPGVDMERFRPKGSDVREQLRNRLIAGIGDEDIVICSVCRLVEEKNLSILLKAFQQVVGRNDSLYQYKLVIAGDGPLRTKLEACAIDLGIDKDVFFVGYTDKAENIFTISDMFVLPSTYEGFGHVHLEANACGIPVIGFKNNPPEILTASDEIICDGVNGKIALNANSESLAEAIMYLTDQIKKEGADIWRSRCVSYVHDSFGWQQHLDKLMELI